jgi:hypothetical protein
MNDKQNASTGAFASEKQRKTERMVGGINGEKREYIRHPVDVSPLLGPE